MKHLPDIRPFGGDVNRSGLTWQAWFAATGRDSHAVKSGWSPVLTEHESLFDAWREGQSPSAHTLIPSCPKCGTPARVALVERAVVRCEINADGSIGRVLSLRGEAKQIGYECGGGHKWDTHQ